MNEENRVQWPTKEGACPETFFQFMGEQEPVGNKGMWEKSVTPRGWALQWDGFALTEIRKRRSGRAPSSTAAEG